jgi:hypothetical protein
MTKRKRREPVSESNAPVRETQPAAKVAADLPVPGDRLFSIRHYVVMNVVFDVFCVLQLLIVYMVLHETKGLLFFFGLLMVGFFAVSVFDYFYDRMFAEPAQSD